MIKEISVILPVYNESTNLEKLIIECLEYLNSRFNTFEIIIVDDGSHDNSILIINKFLQRDNRIFCIVHEKNLGYGKSIRDGINLAKYSWVFFMDADLQFTLIDLDKFISYQNVDLLIGYRANRHDTLLRKIISYIYNLIVRLFFNINFRDISCAFKLMDRKLISSINLSSNSFGINVELLYKAKKSGLRIKEIEISHYKRFSGRTSVTLIKILETMADLLRIRFHK